MDDETLTIGQLAQRFGLNTSAIRYYEANGVLPEPARVSGQRRYGPDAVRRLQVLDVAKRAGFSLDEARVLLQSAQAGTPAFESLRALAARKLPEVEALIARAEAMRAWLRTATDCSCTSLDACALFDPDGERDTTSAGAERLRVTHVAGTYQAPTTPRSPGALKGQIVIAEDFDETPVEFADSTE
ncbi:MAG TPA: MerR family transcriptional regulator [Solirubrobacteraceae bacterium]|jgi:MerR family redox-sensitive transcriptional activator SoxR